ncbi:uncharacterized protein LOC115320994, partial [Ixodes scapularis]|uniref:uncharacterized protein LOC115320994 n=1 Tax=Ixodes scapularis TaxID=6945 RepID=UPI001C38BBD4
LVLSGNLERNWSLFRQKFELFLKATTIGGKSRSTSAAATSEAATSAVVTAAKSALLLSIAGEEALEVFNNFKFLEKETREDYDTVVKKLGEYCAQQQNEVYERFIFRSRMQGESEPVEHFLRDLGKQSRYCHFEGLCDSLIRDQIVFGTKSKKLREKMLHEKDLTLAKAEQMCKAAKARKMQKHPYMELGNKCNPAENVIECTSRETVQHSDEFVTPAKR